LDVDRINDFRVRQGQTREMFARRCKLSRVTLRRVLRGEFVSLGVLRKVAAVVGASPARLIRNSSDVAPEDGCEDRSKRRRGASA
jgi:transcriptional regulator with XRE-family HTH domain